MRKASYTLILGLALLTAYAVSQTYPQGPTQPSPTAPDASQRQPGDVNNPSNPPATDQTSSPDAQKQHEANADKDKMKVDKQALEVKVKDQLGTDPAFSNVEVSAKDNGEVRLKGTVASEDDRKRAVQMAEAIPGVRKVKDKLKVSSSASKSNAPANAGAATTPSASGESASNAGSTSSSTTSGQSTSAGASSMPQSGTAPSSGSTTGSVAGSTSSSAGTSGSNTSSGSNVGGSAQTTSPSSSTAPSTGASAGVGTSTGTSGQGTTSSSTGATTPSTGVGSTGSTSSSTTAGGTGSTSSGGSGSALPQSSGLPQSDTGASASAESSSLQKQIDAALKKEPTLANQNVNVVVTDSTVELSGSVSTGKEKQTAKRIAQSFAGNRRVEDHITVSGRGANNPGSSSDMSNPSGTSSSTTPEQNKGTTPRENNPQTQGDQSQNPR